MLEKHKLPLKYVLEDLLNKPHLHLIKEDMLDLLEFVTLINVRKRESKLRKLWSKLESSKIFMQIFPMTIIKLKYLLR